MKKKIILSLIASLLLSSPSYSAMQSFISADTGGTMRSKLNSNFSEHETEIDTLNSSKEGKAVVQPSAPGDTTVDWYDTDQELGVLILKRHNGTTWVRASSHGVQYASSCASITAGMCVDTDDGKLYYHNGTAVVEVGTGGSGTTYTAGTGIDITSGVISSTVTGTLPPGTEGQGLQKGASAWEATDLAPLTFAGGNISYNSTSGLATVPVTNTATSGSNVPLTSGGAYTALGGKQDALVSGTTIKTINNTSILGSGNIDIAGGTSGGLTSTLSASPYSDAPCTADGVYNHTIYKCVDDGTGTGYFTEYVPTTAYSNATPTGCIGGSDGYIGYATLGTDLTDAGTNLIYYSYYTPTEDGTISQAHGWKLYNDETYQIGLFSQSGTLLATTGSKTGGADPIAEVHSPIESYCLVAGTTYIIGQWRSSAWSGVGTSPFLGEGHNVYSQTLATFGSFVPADVVRAVGRDLTVTLNNSASTF